MKPVIFFDWDGTLADSMPLCIQQLQVALERVGLPPKPPEELALCNGPTYEESVGVLRIPPDKAQAFLDARLKAELELVPTVQRLFPGIREMLTALRPVADLVVLSNGLPGYLSLSLRTLSLTDCFTRVQPAIPGKTKAEALALLLAEMRPDRAVMVGDRLGDLNAGRANNLPTVAACYGFGTPEEWAEADRQAESVERLTALLLDFARR